MSLKMYMLVDDEVVYTINKQTNFSCKFVKIETRTSIIAHDENVMSSLIILLFTVWSVEFVIKAAFQ